LRSTAYIHSNLSLLRWRTSTWIEFLPVFKSFWSLVLQISFIAHHLAQ
jgi:hypothetical protein